MRNTGEDGQEGFVMSAVRPVSAAHLARPLSKEGPPGPEGSPYCRSLSQGRLARPLPATSMPFDKCWVSANWVRE